MEESSHEITSPLISKGGDSSLEPSSSSLKPDPDEENSPIKQVALTVPTKDDPSLSMLTFRMWALGTISCVLLSFLNQFFWYRTEPLTITAISDQIAVVPLGRRMAAKITNRVFFKGTPWEFTLNPGPFNVKERVLITYYVVFSAAVVLLIIAVDVQSPLLFFLALVVIFLFFVVVHVYITALWHLTSVVSVLEPVYGFVTMKKSYELLKGKTRMATALVFVYEGFGIEVSLAEEDPGQSTWPA